MKRSIQFSNAIPTVIFSFFLGYVWVAPLRGVVPPPDGGYPNFTTAEGQNALKHLTSGAGNTAIGWSSLFSITTGALNTAVGAGALALNTADGNTATGADALLLNTSGMANTANGAFALFSNDTGNSNTGLGNQALFTNSTGSFNTATGSFALAANSVGTDNTANGAGALENNTSSQNTAVGSEALLSNTDGFGNTANGFAALANNVSGDINTAIGFQALQNNLSGSDNIALGTNAGSAVTTGSHNVYIASSGVAAETGTIRIGNGVQTTQAYIAGVHGVAVPGGIGVFVDINGHLGTSVSSHRFKEDIKPMANASETILALKPVTFRYKKEFDPDGIPQFGLVAEDVAKVNPDLVARDAKGELYTVRYEAVNAMLLNEFLKEHQKVDDQQKQIEALTTRLKEQEARIQRITNRVEVSKTTSQLADTDW